MSYRVKITGPSASGTFGMDIFTIASPTDVLDRNGVLIVTTPGSPERRKEGLIDGAERVFPAVRSRQVIYPRGGWTRVVIEDVIDDE